MGIVWVKEIEIHILGELAYFREVYIEWRNMII